MDVANLAELLHETADHHDEFEKAAPKHDWWDWYAPYLDARQRGMAPDEAVTAADRYMEQVRHVVRHVDRPVESAAAAKEDSDVGNDVRNILVATDGSSSSAAAVAMGIEVASERDAHLTFVHVVPLVDLVPAVGFVGPESAV